MSQPLLYQYHHHEHAPRPTYRHAPGLPSRRVGREDGVGLRSKQQPALVIVFIVVIIDIRFIFIILIVILQHGCRDETSHSREFLG